MEPWLESLLKSMNEEDGMTEKQVRVVEAAVEVFADKGFAAASTSEIAARAGVAEGTIFRHYKTKQALLFAIVTPIMSRLVAPVLLRDFLKVFDTEYDRFEDFLRAVLRNRLEFAVHNAPVVKIMLHEIPFQPELRARFQSELFPQVQERMVAMIGHFQARGELRELPPLALFRVCATAIAGYILLRAVFMPDLAWDDDVEIEQTVEFIMRGVAAR